MKADEIKVGKWYMIERYGFDRFIKGKCHEIIDDDYVVMKFFWGAPIRSKEVTKISNLLKECKRPPLFSNI